MSENPYNLNDKQIAQIAKGLSETFKTMGSMYKQVSSNLNMMIEPIKQMMEYRNELLLTVEKWRKEYQPYFDEIKKQVSSTKAKQFKAIEKLGENQLIWFNNLDCEIVGKILNGDNITDIMTQYLKANNYSEINEIIRKSSEMELLKEQKILYDQSVSAYHNENYYLGCMGFSGIIDWLMSKTTEDLSTSSKRRIDKIFEKLELEKVIDSIDLPLFSAIYNIEPVLSSLFNFSHFIDEEPEFLNRHWIAHGRSLKEYTKLDCIKLINLIYALLLIGSVESGE